MSDDTEQHPDPDRWWRHRRWMAWLAMAGIVALGAAAALGLTPEHSAPLAQSVAWVLAGVVAVYSGGASAVDAVAKLRR